jgi:putative tryptophan/tyrosine transport system substrate-binding protein
MRRRVFITLLGGAAFSPIAAWAQPTDRMRRIGVLMALTENNPEAKAWLAALRQGLEKRGWLEGRNLRIDYRFMAGQRDRVPALASELLAEKPDVILAHTTGVAVALQRESHTTPIVFVHISDPIGAGLVPSLSRPGGNITGVLHYEAGIVGKWLGMLKEIAPRLTRIALIANPKTTAFDYFLRSAEAAAPSLAIELVSRRIETAADIEREIELFGRLPDSGLLVPPDATTITHRDIVVALAARHRLPAVYALRLFPAAGGLMSYGTDQDSLFRLAASYLDRILRGDKPADLPVQAPTRYETAINLKTARTLGLSVPPALLVAADEVIE